MFVAHAHGDLPFAECWDVAYAREEIALAEAPSHALQVGHTLAKANFKVNYTLGAGLQW